MIPVAPSTLKLPSQHDQGDVRGHAQRREYEDRVAAGAESLRQLPAVVVSGGEELPVALVPAVHGADEDRAAVDGEQGADAVELGREDLEDDEGEAEQREGGAGVGALKGALGGADLDESFWGLGEGELVRGRFRVCWSGYVCGRMAFREQWRGTSGEGGGGRLMWRCR